MVELLQSSHHGHVGRTAGERCVRCVRRRTFHRSLKCSDAVPAGNDSHRSDSDRITQVLKCTSEVGVRVASAGWGRHSQDIDLTHHFRLRPCPYNRRTILEFARLSKPNFSSGRSCVYGKRSGLALRPQGPQSLM